MMTPSGETTLEDEIIYSPEISKLLDETQKRIEDGTHVGSLRMTLETLVFRAIRSWTGEGE